jgi:hypothetical protein
MIQARALQVKMWLLKRHENPQCNRGETGIFVDMSMQHEAILWICSSCNGLQIYLNCSKIQQQRLAHCSGYRLNQKIYLQ